MFCFLLHINGLSTNWLGFLISKLDNFQELFPISDYIDRFPGLTNVYLQKVLNLYLQVLQKNMLAWIHSIFENLLSIAEL